MKVYLYSNEGPFPIIARWVINNVAYCSVFENVEQAKGYFAGRYGIYKRDYDKVFVDRREYD